MSASLRFFLLFFFFNDTATTEIYTLSLHDALPIICSSVHRFNTVRRLSRADGPMDRSTEDRKSTRLNSSHTVISYAVFCLKKKKKNKNKTYTTHTNKPIHQQTHRNHNTEHNDQCTR